MPHDQINKTKGSLSLIPQMFYDIIARIIPGLIIIVVVYFILSDAPFIPTKLKNALYWFSNSDSPKTFVFFSFMLCSYVISTVTGQLAVFFEKFFKSILDRQFNKIRTKVVDDFNKTFSKNFTNNTFPSIAIMYDYVRLYEPGPGARLVKLRAEVHMCRNISFGLFLIAVIDIILRYTSYTDTFSLSSLDYLIVVFAVISFIATYYKRRGLYLWGLCNHWILLRGYCRFDESVDSLNQGEITNPK